ncbi:MAG: hydrogenase maturation protease [candidate division Zixibacteria bacterium]|nr:hydrogenase maturation protease [candidate division Zixibacteria bacterium]
MPAAPVVIIGQGNEFRGDDGAGPEVIRRLKTRGVDRDNRVAVITGPLDVVGIINEWQNTALTIFIDAVLAQGPPGKIHTFHPLISPIPEAMGTLLSTHDTPPFTKALELGQAIDRLPHELVVYCIEGQNLTHKIGLTAEVDQAVDRIVDMISETIRQFLSGTSQ